MFVSAAVICSTLVDLMPLRNDIQIKITIKMLSMSIDVI